VIVPGVTVAGSRDHNHLVSAVDLLPTLLELTGVTHPGRMDGRSFAPLLRGESLPGRDWVIKEYNENSGGSREPMRAIQTRKFLYVFNPWSNGERIMATATTGTPTYRRLAELARTDPRLAARHRLYQHRVIEELYDVERDPDCLENLVVNEEYRTELDRLRGLLEGWMNETADPMLAVFRQRDNAEVREAFVASQEREAANRGTKAPSQAKKKKKKRKAKT
ncbi:MAG: sulfatase/phosphatase domain-containing protein, partial [Pirellulaceae bacterium]